MSGTPTGSRSTWTSAAAPPQHGEESLQAALAAGPMACSVRYRGFVLIPQSDLGWLVRPERSPMTVLPFRTPPISLSDVKALVDWRLEADGHHGGTQAATGP
jgi:hypothetical protein